MNHPEHSPEERASSRTVITVRAMELIVAVALALGSLITMWSNYQLGSGWSSYGPEPGYFPMRLGIIILIVWWASVGTRGPNRYGEDPLG